MTKAYATQRHIDGLGTTDVLEVKIDQEESARFHQQPLDKQRAMLEEAGLTKDLSVYYKTNDSDGNMYYFEVA